MSSSAAAGPRVSADLEQSIRDVSAQLQHKASEAKEEAALKAGELKAKATQQTREARKQAEYAWHDTKQFVHRHPLVVLALLTSAVLLGPPAQHSTQHTAHSTA